jgi:type VI secretion system protein ImpJ
MPNFQVHWYEGMFLRPQHFQAADRYWHEQLSLHFRFDHLFDYGLATIRFDKNALGNGIFEFFDFVARTKSGVFVSVEHFRGEIKLSNVGAATVGTITAFLAVPDIRTGEENVARNGESKVRRYDELVDNVTDESAGGKLQRLEFLRTQTQILFLAEGERPKGYELLQICQLRKDPTQPNSWKLVGEMFPPCIAMSAWSDLKGLLTTIYDFIGQRLNQLDLSIDKKGINFDSRDPGNLQLYMLLHALNEAYSELHLMVNADKVHPFFAYQALVRTIGKLSIFGKSRRITDQKAYDHENLYRIFNWAFEQIKSLVFITQDEPFEQFPMVGIRSGMHVELPRQVLLPEWKWFFGIKPINVTRSDFIAGIVKQRNLLWDYKLSSSGEIESVWAQRAKGIFIRPPIDGETPAVLKPLRDKWVIFAVEDDLDWEKVRSESNWVVLRVSEKQIEKPELLEGSRQLYLYVNDKRFTVEVSFFAVKTKNSSN